MFTLSADVQRRVSDRVCRFVGGLLGMEPPETYAAPWEILVDGYLPLEIHSQGGHCYFVGVLVDTIRPEERPALLSSALALSREHCGRFRSAICLDSQPERLLIWNEADAGLADEDLRESFAVFLKEFDAIFAELVPAPSAKREDPVGVMTWRG